MSTRYRLICHNCNKVVNIDNYRWVCPECHTQLNPDPGFIQVYRKGNYFGMMMPFGVFVDGRQRGVIGNKETMRICVPYGRHVVRIGESQDLIFDITPEQPAAFVRAYMRVGAWKSTMQIEAISQAEMPEGNEPHNISTLSAAPAQPAIAPAQPVTPAVAISTPVAPVAPVVAPVEPVVAPIEPVVAPVEPVIAPVQPVVAPAQPARDYCFCFNCGTKLSITDKFCFKCGSPVKHG